MSKINNTDQSLHAVTQDKKQVKIILADYHIFSSSSQVAQQSIILDALMCTLHQL